MICEQDDRVRSERHTLSICQLAEDDLSGSVRTVEPALEELLEDPIMRLLWRADGLEPARARATLLGLQDLVKRTSRARAEHGATAPRRRRSLAA